MHLETVKLVAFALWAEADAGTASESPEEIIEAWEKLGQATSIEDVRQFLGPDLDYKLDNYLETWRVPVEEAAPPTEREQVEAVETSGLTPQAPPPAKKRKK